VLLIHTLESTGQKETILEAIRNPKFIYIDVVYATAIKVSMLHRRSLINDARLMYMYTLTYSFILTFASFFVNLNYVRSIFNAIYIQRVVVFYWLSYK